LTEPDVEVVWEEGHRKLRFDPVFGPLVREVGPVTMAPRLHTPFAYLARAIVYQQLAGAAARTIHGRVVEALDGTVTPAAVLEAPEELLRGAGLSRNKTAAVRDLAAKVAHGEVETGDLEEQTDSEVIRRLTRVRGIGPWTARMFLMFHLRRPDVWPVGDLGVRQGYARLHGLDAPVPEREMEARGDAYRPWRSAVAWYCWRALDTESP
jgi:3-methyladenine DNA glycosylase/8-oxoguanine DNA glycosylase